MSSLQLPSTTDSGLWLGISRLLSLTSVCEVQQGLLCEDGIRNLSWDLVSQQSRSRRSGSGCLVPAQFSALLRLENDSGIATEGPILTLPLCVS